MGRGGGVCSTQPPTKFMECSSQRAPRLNITVCFPLKAGDMRCDMLESRNSRGSTPLYLASAGGNLTAIEALLAAGAGSADVKG